MAQEQIGSAIPHLVVRINEKCVATKTCNKCFWYKKDDRHRCKEFFNKYVCKAHKTNVRICKCKIQNPTPVVNNVSVNKTVLGCAGFNTEKIKVYFGDKSMKVLVKYDSYSSHSSISADVVKN